MVSLEGAYPALSGREPEFLNVGRQGHKLGAADENRTRIKFNRLKDGAQIPVPRTAAQLWRSHGESNPERILDRDESYR